MGAAHLNPLRSGSDRQFRFAGGFELQPGVGRVLHSDYLQRSLVVPDCSDYAQGALSEATPKKARA